jgi:organic hydroperoxide reductase OsmC/OhrA
MAAVSHLAVRGRSGQTACMAEHVVTTRWQLREGDAFAGGKYSRRHTWEFDSGQIVDASPSPSVVPVPYSDPSCIDPEEAFVAAIASCHLLTFLYLAHRRGWQVRSYEDRAVGVLEKNERRVPWVSRVTLRPRVVFEGPAPEQSEQTEVHHRAHEECFIANSVKTEIVVELNGE